jgi:hypothetical protein
MALGGSPEKPKRSNEQLSVQLLWRRSSALVVPAWSGKGRKPTRQRLKTPSNAAYRVDGLLWRLPKTA